jgi:hypothetical protein
MFYTKAWVATPAIATSLLVYTTIDLFMKINLSPEKAVTHQLCTYTCSTITGVTK